MTTMYTPCRGLLNSLNFRTELTLKTSEALNPVAESSASGALPCISIESSHEIRRNIGYLLCPD